MVDLLVIQPTPFCNIDCKYCYLPTRSVKNKITLSTLDKIIQRALDDKLIGDELCIVWHAGEPLTVPVEYFRDLLALVAEKVALAKVIHSIQTNGMLITDKWCELFKEFGVRVGISLDGPREVNDVHRTSRSGQGTFEKTMQGVRLLKLHDIPYHAIAVVSRNSLAYPDEIFEFFHQNGFYQLGLNIEETEGANSSSTLNRNDNDEAVVHFFGRIFDRYISSDGLMSIREFDNSFNAVLRNPAVLDITKHKIYSHQTAPLGIISVDYEGNFSTFSPELLGEKSEVYKDFNLGNVYETGFLAALLSAKFKAIAGDIAKGIHRCKKHCAYYHVCGGGAPANKFYENGSFDSTETMYCKYTIKTPIDIVLNYLEECCSS